MTDIFEGRRKQNCAVDFVGLVTMKNFTFWSTLPFSEFLSVIKIVMDTESFRETEEVTKGLIARR